MKVTLNCYRNLDTGEMHLENQWLNGVATDTWMRRVTDLTVPCGPLAHADLTFDRRLARKTGTRKKHQELREAWNFATRLAFENVGASAFIVEEPLIPF